MGEIARSLHLHGGVPGRTAKKIGDAINEILNIEMDDAADVTGSLTTQTIGFQVTNWKNQPYKAEVSVHFAVFRDIDKAIPASGAGSPNGVISVAAEGSILSTGGTAAEVVKTDANGRFSCTLTLTSALFPHTLYVGCMQGSGPVIDCRSVDSITFSA